MYQLLLNQTYLYLLQNPMEDINKSKLGEILGINRKTVSKELEAFGGKAKNTFHIKNFHNDIPNKYDRALAIIGDIDKKIYTISEMSKLLGVSTVTLAKYYRPMENVNAPRGGVYAIFEGDVCIYVGFSTNIYERFIQHSTKIDSGNGDAKLYKYCKEKHLTSSQLRFVVLCQSNDITAMKLLEQNLYREFRPAGNDWTL